MDLGQAIGHERRRVERRPQFGEEPLRRARPRLQRRRGGKRAGRRPLGIGSAGLQLLTLEREQLAPLPALSQRDPLAHPCGHRRVGLRLGCGRGQDQARDELGPIDGEPQGDPPAARLGLDGHRAAQIGHRHPNRRAGRPRVEHPVRIGRVIGDRPAHDRDRAGLRAARPSACHERLGARQRPQAGLDAAHHDQGPAGATGKPETLDTPPGEGQVLDGVLIQLQKNQ